MEEPRRTRRWWKRRAEIVHCAEEVFAARGFGGTSLEDVAARTDLRRASLVYYFQDKESLYDAVYLEILRELVQRVSRVKAIRNPLERLDAIVSDWADFTAERPHAAHIILRHMTEALPRPGDACMELFGALFTILHETVAEGEEVGLLRSAEIGHFAVTIAGASLLWACGNHVVKRAYAFDTLSPENREGHRQMLRKLTRQLLDLAPEGRVSPGT